MLETCFYVKAQIKELKITLTIMITQRIYLEATCHVHRQAWGILNTRFRRAATPSRSITTCPCTDYAAPAEQTSTRFTEPSRTYVLMESASFGGDAVSLASSRCTVSYLDASFFTFSFRFVLCPPTKYENKLAVTVSRRPNDPSSVSQAHPRISLITCHEHLNIICNYLTPLYSHHTAFPHHMPRDNSQSENTTDHL